MPDPQIVNSPDGQSRGVRVAYALNFGREPGANPVATLLLALVALIGWAALVAQLYLILAAREVSGAAWLPGLINYLSFFTVQSNLQVACVCSARLLLKSGRCADFFRQPNVATSITASILLTGIAYSVLLRHLWTPQGMQWWVDETLHDFIPLAFFIYWLFGIEKGALRKVDIASWLFYPLAYLGYALLRGHWTSAYQYPFLDVSQLGYYPVLLNTLGVLIGFLVIAFGLYGLDRSMGRRQTGKRSGQGR